jgi:hypothetical protein
MGGLRTFQPSIHANFTIYLYASCGPSLFFSCSSLLTFPLLVLWFFFLCVLLRWEKSWHFSFRCIIVLLSGFCILFFCDTIEIQLLFITRFLNCLTWLLLLVVTACVVQVSYMCILISLALVHFWTSQQVWKYIWTVAVCTSYHHHIMSITLQWWHLVFGQSKTKRVPEGSASSRVTSDSYNMQIIWQGYRYYGEERGR